MPRTHSRAIVVAAAVFLAFAACPAPAPGQQLNPVYTDDSPVARETLQRIAQFVAGGNKTEAVRELQRLLDENADRLVAAEGQPDLFISVRQRVHAILLGSPELLGIYRGAESARAARDLEAGDTDAVERSRLLTPAGFEAALRVAQLHLESARFDAASIALRQLEAHPDRSDRALAADTAALAAEVARYLNTAESRDAANRWAALAGLPPPGLAPVPLPPLLLAPQHDVHRPAGALERGGVPSRPLWSVPIEPQPMPIDVEDQMDRAQQATEDLLNSLWIYPTVAGDTVYINDGTFIAARDRFTLQPRWSTRPTSAEPVGSPFAARGASVSFRTIEDICTVTISGRTLVATMGVAENGDRGGDPGTFALDTATGRVLWSVLVHRLDPQLDGASVRSPAVIDGDTVVLGARKITQGRRIVGFYLVGLSLHTGELRWVRPIGSAGSIPWSGGDRRVHPAALLADGVVYCTDPLGVVAAIEAATGRPVWVLRVPVPAFGAGPPEVVLPWLWDTPLLMEGSLLTLSPDRSELLVLDRRTGAIIGRRNAASLGAPAYLLRIGGSIAAVGIKGVVFLPAGDPASGEARPTGDVSTPIIRGRAIVAGDRLLIPRIDGFLAVNPDEPKGPPDLIRAERFGTALPLDSQLLVLDSRSIHSYLSWDVAQRLLQQRMEANPDDPEPAITYADLAYRSQKHDQIARAADHALTAIDKAPTAETNRAARQRLFRVLKEMVEASQEKWAPGAAAAPPPVVRREQPGRRGPAAPPPDITPPLGLAEMSQAIDRLGRCASSPDERVSHLFVLGRLRDAEMRYASAAECYQTVLFDPLLSAAPWHTRTAAVRAEVEATRRLRQLAVERGSGVYAAFEAQAAHELQALGSAAGAEALERLARRFPASAASAEAWSRAADAHEASGKAHAAVAALREGLAAAENAQASGAVGVAPIGAIAGRLVASLRRLDQVFAAAQLLNRLRREYPDLTMTDRGATLELESTNAELLASLAGLQRLPRIGTALKGDAQGLAGWVLMTPRSREHAGADPRHDSTGRAPEHAMLINPTENKVALWGVAGVAEPAGAATQLQMLWSREYRGRPPIVLRLGPESVYLLWRSTEAGGGAVVERIGAVGGETRWRTEPFRSLFPADEELDLLLLTQRHAIETPLDGVVLLADVVTSMDEQSLTIVERSGRIAVFDLDSGRLRWAAASSIGQVHDVDTGAGVVAIGGARLREGNRRAVGDLLPGIAVYDGRTGEVIHNFTNINDSVRWLRIAERGDRGAALIAGFMAQVDCIDLARANTRWSIVGGPAFGALEAWTFDDRLYLLDQNRSLWQARLSTGELARQPLETYEHLVGNGRVESIGVGGERTLAAFTTERGVCVFDADGVLVGIDSMVGHDESITLTMPAPSARYFVAAETTPRQAESGQTVYNMHVVDAATGKLQATHRLALDLPPRRIVVLDGRILVTAGNNTVVYPAPESDR